MILTITSIAVNLADFDVPATSRTVTSRASRKAIRLKLPVVTVPSARVMWSKGPAVNATGKPMPCACRNPLA